MEEPQEVHSSLVSLDTYPHDGQILFKLSFSSAFSACLLLSFSLQCCLLIGSLLPMQTSSVVIYCSQKLSWQ